MSASWRIQSFDVYVLVIESMAILILRQMLAALNGGATRFTITQIRYHADGHISGVALSDLIPNTHLAAPVIELYRSNCYPCQMIW